MWDRRCMEEWKTEVRNKDRGLREPYNRSWQLVKMSCALRRQIVKVSEGTVYYDF